MKATLFIFCLLWGSVLGCDKPQVEPLTAGSAGRPRPAPDRAGPGSDQSASLAPTTLSPTALDKPRALPVPDSTSVHGRVLADKALGMVVTGVEGGTPSRSLDDITDQLRSFLPQLEQVYEREREHDPGLLGRLDVSLTIAAGGEVSDLRFPARQLSDEKLIAPVFDQMRSWRFPPAVDQVQLRCPLLFVPPGIDPASVLLWEQRLSSRAAVAGQKEEGRTGQGAAPTSALDNPPPVPRLPQTSAAAEVRTAVAGWYRVTRPTALHAAPREAADLVAPLALGTRVRVVGLVADEWLEVRSVGNRPPGFLRRGDAVPEDGQ